MHIENKLPISSFGRVKLYADEAAPATLALCDSGKNIGPCSAFSVVD